MATFCSPTCYRTTRLHQTSEVQVRSRTSPSRRRRGTPRRSRGQTVARISLPESAKAAEKRVQIGPSARRRRCRWVRTRDHLRQRSDRANINARFPREMRATPLFSRYPTALSRVKRGGGARVVRVVLDGVTAVGPLPARPVSATPDTRHPTRPDAGIARADRSCSRRIAPL